MTNYRVPGNELEVMIQNLEARFTRSVPKKYENVRSDAPMYGDGHYPTKSFAQLFYEKCTLQEPNSLGEYVQSLVQGTDFIDLGCGKKPEIHTLAKQFRARSYIGVDLNFDSEIDWQGKLKHKNLTEESQRVNGLCQEKKMEVVYCAQEEDFTQYYVFDDLLYFVTKMNESQGTCFFASGLEVPDYMKRDRIFPDWTMYFEALYTELGRVCKSGDAVIINHSMDFETKELMKFGFQEQMSFGKGYPSFCVKE